MKTHFSMVVLLSRTGPAHTPRGYAEPGTTTVHGRTDQDTTKP